MFLLPGLRRPLFAKDLETLSFILFKRASKSSTLGDITCAVANKRDGCLFILDEGNDVENVLLEFFLGKCKNNEGDVPTCL